MQVCDGCYDNRSSIHTIDQPVRKTGQQTTAHPRFNRRAGHRKGRDSPNRPVQFVKKFLP